MKINFTLKATIVMLLISFISFGQNEERKVFGRTSKSVNPKNGLIRCASTEYEEYLQEKNPNRASESEFESWLAPKVAKIKQDILAGKNVSAVVTIPVVVHVIHNGDNLGSNENISDARVLSQITVLNQDFRRMTGTPGYNTNAVGADVEIQFCMAVRKPDGTATNGIDRVNLGTASWASTSSFDSSAKTATSWDPTQYFNIWVCQFSNALGLLGYGQFPSNSGLSGINTNGGAANTDGVVIDYRCFGSKTLANVGTYYASYDKGRTATHEIGHCFGLRHIWGDGGNQESNSIDCTATDYCADTPPAGWDNYDCAATYDTCTADSFPDMVENYMDYTNDSCMNIFTIDQKARMLAVLQNSPRRSTLPASTVCTSLSSSEFELLENVNLYPNPSNDVVTISISYNNELPDNYKLYNNLGQLVYSKNITSTSDLNINISNLSNGVYFVTLEKDNKAKTLKFIKK